MLDIITIGDIKLDTFVLLHDASLQCQLLKSPIHTSATPSNSPLGRGRIEDCRLCLDYGAKIDVKVVDSQVAGSAPNVARGLARQKHKTAIVSVMGKDTTRPLALEALKNDGVDTRLIESVKNEASAFAVVLNFKGERTLLTSPMRHRYHLPVRLPKTRWLYLCEMGAGYERIYRDVLALKKKHGIFVSLNPGTAQLKPAKKILYDLITCTDLLFVNKQEAQKITESQTADVHHLCAAIAELGAKAVVVTDSKNGSWAFDGKACFHCPVFPAKRVEATGAGDAFATGVLSALLSGHDLSEGLRWGSVNAASVIEYVGPTKGLLTTAQIKSRLEQHPSFKAKKI